jgi:hypothetical protein
VAVPRDARVSSREALPGRMGLPKIVPQARSNKWYWDCIVVWKDVYVNELLNRYRAGVITAVCCCAVSSNDAAAPLETGGDGRAPLRI